MTTDILRDFLEGVRRGDIDDEAAERFLRRLPYGDGKEIRLDHHRPLRQGLVEAVYAPGKTVAQCREIVAELLSHGAGGPVLVTRTSDDQATDLLTRHPGGRRLGDTLLWRPQSRRPERVVVATAGTSDLPVATEAAATLEAYGFDARLIADVGVAGLHRVLDHLDLLAEADAVIVVAGMEGALASVVGGLTAAPVVAVPTSTGYGASLEGVTALLAMLAGCSAGVSVVGIDNGFGAACCVTRVLGPRPGQGPAA